MPPDSLEVGYVPEAQNMVFEDGSPHQRRGYQDLGDQLSGRVMLLDEYRMLDGTTYPMAVTATKVYSHASGSWTDRTNDALDASGGDPHSAAIMLDTWIFSNGTDAIQTWNGSDASVSDLGGASDYNASQTVHKAKCVLAYKDRLHIFHTTEDSTAIPQRHRYSELGKIDEWDEGEGGGFTDIVEDPAGITGAVTHGDSVLIFKPRSITALDYVGGARFGYTTISSTQGTSAPRTLRNLDTITFFLGRDNVYAVSGNEPEAIGSPIWPQIREVLVWDNLAYAHAVVLPHLHEYRLFIPIEGSTLLKAFCFDYDRGQWDVRTYPDITASAEAAIGTALSWDNLGDYSWGQLSQYLWGTFTASAGRARVLMGDADGYVYEETDMAVNDASNRDGHSTTAIDGWVSTPDVTGGEGMEAHLKRFTGASFEAKGQSAEVAYSTDGGMTWTAAEEVTLQPNEWTQERAYFDAVGERCRVRLRNRNEGEWLSVRTVSVNGSVTGLR